MIKQHNAQDECQQVFDPDVMADATYAMQQVVKRGTAHHRQPARPPGGGQDRDDRRDNKSAWFAGFTPQYATAVAMYRQIAKSGGAVRARALGRRRRRDHRRHAARAGLDRVHEPGAGRRPPWRTSRSRAYGGQDAGPTPDATVTTTAPTDAPTTTTSRAAAGHADAHPDR